MIIFDLFCPLRYELKSMKFSLNWKKIIVFSLLALISQRAEAVYPGSLWSSERLGDTLIGVAVGSFLGAHQSQIATLSASRLTIHQLNEGKLSKVLEYQKKGMENWMKVSSLDLDADGRDEVLLSGLFHQNPYSVVGHVEEGKWVVLEELPIYLRVLVWEGKRQVVGQRRLGQDDFSGPLLLMHWDGKHLVKEKEVKLPGRLAPQDLSLYSVWGVAHDQQNGFMTLGSDSRLRYYDGGDAKKAHWTSVDSYGGSVASFNYQLRGVMNNIESKRFLVPMNFMSNQIFLGWIRTPLQSDPNLLGPPEPPQAPWLTGAKLEVYAVRNSGYLGSMVGIPTSIKSSQMARLGWTGYGFQEDWSSPKLDGGISDFTLVDWDGDGREEILVSFLLRDAGYSDTLKRQDSLLMVIKPGN